MSNTFKVCSGQCDQCLFSENKIVSNERRKKIIVQCLREDSHFLCHKGTLAGEQICCRGWYDTYGWRTNLIRIAQRLGCVEEVDVDELSKRAKGTQS